MKRSPDDKSLLERLGPSRFAAEGFLGSDQRDIDDIITHDVRALERLGVSKEALVEALKNAYAKARDAMGGSVEIRPGVEAVFYESKGNIPSPFRGDGVFPKGEAALTERETGRRLFITALGINLIEKHDFFQGRGSRYRIEPSEAVRILALTPFANTSE